MARALIASLGIALAFLLAFSGDAEAQGRKGGRVDTVYVTVHDTVEVVRVDTVRITVTDTIVDTLVILLDTIQVTVETQRTDTLVTHDSVHVTPIPHRNTGGLSTSGTSSVGWSVTGPPSTGEPAPSPCARSLPSKAVCKPGPYVPVGPRGRRRPPGAPGPARAPLWPE